MRQGIIIAASLIVLAGVGVALIMTFGAPQQNPTAIPDTAAPVGGPNAAAPPPAETGTAGAGNTTANQSGTTSGGAAGGLYSGP